jgi:hypothetical protein
MDTFYGPVATEMLHEISVEDNPNLYWKLRVAEMIASPRCNIPLKNSLELYVYDQLLPGMTSWEDYYRFLMDMIEKYDNE